MRTSANLDIAESDEPRGVAPRIRKGAVAAMLGVSARTVLDMARAGRLPGAAQVGKLWTFDPAKIRAHVARLEAEAQCPRHQIYFSAAVSTTRACTRMGASS